MSIPSTSAPTTRRWRLLHPVRLSTFLLLVLAVALTISLAIQRMRERQLCDAIAVYRNDPRGEALFDALDRPMRLDYPDGATLDVVLKEISNRGKMLPWPPGTLNTIPMYVDPIGLEETGQTIQSKVRRPASADTLPLGEHLRRILGPLGLDYDVTVGNRGNGFLWITAKESLDVAPDPYALYRDVLR